MHYEMVAVLEFIVAEVRITEVMVIVKTEFIIGAFSMLDFSSKTAVDTQIAAFAKSTALELIPLAIIATAVVENTTRVEAFTVEIIRMYQIVVLISLD